MENHQPDLGLGLAPNATLILARITEPSTNDLQLIVAEAKRQSEAVSTILGPANPVVPDASSRGFELTWRNYVAYVVRNESYCQQEPGEPSPSGRIGTHRHDSAFLTYVATTTFATDEYPGPLTQWFINADWHCIDVVSDTGPEIRELTPEVLKRLLAELDAPVTTYDRL